MVFVLKRRPTISRKPFCKIGDVYIYQGATRRQGPDDEHMSTIMKGDLCTVVKYNDGGLVDVLLGFEDGEDPQWDLAKDNDWATVQFQNGQRLAMHRGDKSFRKMR